MNEREIINTCTEALSYILTAAQQTLFYLNDKDFELSSLREKFKVLEFKPTAAYNRDQTIGTTKEDITAFSFTEKEYSKMPKKFKNEFRTGRVKARVRQREDGRYEIRCQINNQKITASSKKLEVAKEKFIERLKITANPQSSLTAKTVKLGDYMKKWLETVKKPYVKPNTYKFYLQTFNAYVIPRLGERDLMSIKAFELQDLINDFTNVKKFRTAQKVYLLLSAVFDYAVSDELLQRSPMKKVIVGVYEQEHGTPLTRSEEAEFIRAFKKEPSVLHLVYKNVVHIPIIFQPVANISR